MATYQNLAVETELIIDEHDDNVMYRVWEWVIHGYDHILVPQSFKDAWNMCNVLDWIMHRDVYGARFESVHARVHPRVLSSNDRVKRLLKKACELTDDMRVVSIIMDAIHKI